MFCEAAKIKEGKKIERFNAAVNSTSRNLGNFSGLTEVFEENRGIRFVLFVGQLSLMPETIHVS